MSPEQLTYYRGLPALVALFGKIQSSGVDRVELCYFSIYVVNKQVAANVKGSSNWVLVSNSWLFSLIQKYQLADENNFSSFLLLNRFNWLFPNHMLLLYHILNNSSAFLILFSLTLSSLKAQLDLQCCQPDESYPQRHVSFSCICSLAATSHSTTYQIFHILHSQGKPKQVQA